MTRSEQQRTVRSNVRVRRSRGFACGGVSNNDLLRTLQEFFESGRSVRETAVRLDVHENTVRHRLGRVHDLTGLDVAANSNDQLSAQTALLILRLQGHHAVPGFDRVVR
ncbi:PucR family transcriptional regulator [Rhodococcus opacus]|nr:PucR family transcriptional regulator [Rhodococcus opacus]